MTMLSTPMRYGLALLGPVALAVAGATHPARFTAESAAWWHDLHVILLPLFPLLALTVWMVLGPVWTGVDGWLATAARILALVYAAFYGALDVLAGIAAGALAEYQEATGNEIGRSVSVVFGQASMLGAVGTWSLLAAFGLVGVVLFRRTGVRSLPGSVVALVASWSFMSSHVYPPWGVVTMLAFGAAAVLLLRAETYAHPFTRRRVGADR